MSIHAIKDYMGAPALVNRITLLNNLCAIIRDNKEDFHKIINIIMVAAGTILPKDRSKVDPKVYTLKEKLKYDVISVIFDLFIIIRCKGINTGKNPTNRDLHEYIQAAISAAPNMPIDGVVIGGSSKIKLIMIIHKLGDDRLELVMNSIPLTRVVLERINGTFKSTIDNVHDLGCKH